ncbi:ribonuclease inhibitor-like [Lepisosteus oculatus]|uniref:ribonuclease inhibitor-like n=1 Tax=Lepisosteus oculatus TaxID=7918 RepID=UPI0035F5161E
MEEVKQFLRSGSLSGRCLSPEQLSALAFVLMMAEEPLDVFDMKTYTTSMDGCLRLLPLIKYCRQALLDHCNLTGECCKALISAVQSNPSHLRVLDLRSNYSAGKEVKLLCSVLRNPACKMETLRLSGCQITECGCEALASALQSRPSSLTELDLSHNCLGDTGVKKLFALLETPSCKLEKLK